MQDSEWRDKTKKLCILHTIVRVVNHLLHLFQSFPLLVSFESDGQSLLCEYDGAPAIPSMDDEDAVKWDVSTAVLSRKARSHIQF